MRYDPVPSQKRHFHIHWINHDNSDWEPFDTRQDAHDRALELVRPGETFTIEECRAPCPVCEHLQKGQSFSMDRTA
jgi:hypothetical protein